MWRSWTSIASAPIAASNVRAAANGYSIAALAPRGARRLTGTQPRRPRLPWGRGEEHPMQLDQEPRPGPAGEPDVDLTSDTPILRSGTSRRFGLAAAIERVLGGSTPIAIECYDGSRVGPDNAKTALIIKSPKALQYAVTAPGEIGIARAYVSGELDVRGDIFDALALRENLPEVKLSPAEWLDLARIAGWRSLRPLPPPPEESRLQGRRHSRARDASAIAHHYNVSNDFYRMVLGPSMTYSCAVWPTVDAGLETAQA